MTPSKPLAALLLGSLAVLGPVAARADDTTVVVEQPWARATPGGAKTGAVYLTVIDHGAPDRLIGISTPAADMAMLHESSIVNGVAQMRMLDSLNIPAGAKLALSPGGKHIMLMGMKGVPKEGEHVTIIFTDSLGCATSAEFSVQANAP